MPYIICAKLYEYFRTRDPIIDFRDSVMSILKLRERHEKNVFYGPLAARSRR